MNRVYLCSTALISPRSCRSTRSIGASPQYEGTCPRVVGGRADHACCRRSHQLAGVIGRTWLHLGSQRHFFVSAVYRCEGRLARVLRPRQATAHSNQGSNPEHPRKVRSGKRGAGIGKDSSRALLLEIPWGACVRVWESKNVVWIRYLGSPLWQVRVNKVFGPLLLGPCGIYQAFSLKLPFASTLPLTNSSISWTPAW